MGYKENIFKELDGMKKNVREKRNYYDAK